MNELIKELYNIINNNITILINDELILDITNSLIQYTVNNNSVLHYFTNIYRNTILSNDEYIYDLKQELYISTNNKQLKQYINTLNMPKFINELVQTKIFANFFNKIFLILTTANDIIDNLSYNQEWLSQILIHILDKLANFVINLAANNNISANEQISNLIKNNELIKFFSYELREYYNINKFFLSDINEARIHNNYYPIFLRGKIANNEFYKIAQFIYDKYNDMFIDYLIDNVDFLQADINARSASELDKINIANGESIPINGRLFHELTHSDKYIPIIYINGNVIAGQVVNDIDNGRIHHSSLFKAYCKDMSLHKLDKIKKSPEEWNNIIKGVSLDSPEMNTIMEQYQCVRAVQSVSGTAVAIIIAYNNVNEAANAFKKQLSNCDKVFACNDSWTELTKEAKLKRLMRKII